MFIIIDSEDDCRTSCGNVSHCQQQYYSGLRSPTTYLQPWSKHLGTLKKLGTNTYFAKLTHVLPLKKAWGCCYKGLFLRSPSLPSSVDCVALKLECITSTLHRGGRGKGRYLILTSYCVSVCPRSFAQGCCYELQF